MTNLKKIDMGYQMNLFHPVEVANEGAKIQQFLDSKSHKSFELGFVLAIQEKTHCAHGLLLQRVYRLMEMEEDSFIKKSAEGGKDWNECLVFTFEDYRISIDESQDGDGRFCIESISNDMLLGSFRYEYEKQWSTTRNYIKRIESCILRLFRKYIKL